MSLVAGHFCSPRGCLVDNALGHPQTSFNGSDCCVIAAAIEEAL